MRDVVILGVGMTNFGRFPERPVSKIGAEAVVAALKDAGIAWKDIPAMYCAHSLGGIVDGELVEAELGLFGIPVINVSNACAGGNTAVFAAYQAIAYGIHDIILAMGVDQAPKGPLGAMAPPNPDNVMALNSMLSKYAMKMQRAIYEKRYTLDQMALVSVKNHNNALLNPRSQYQIKLKGVADVHNSRMIADPMTLYHCCPTSDGAAAVIFCSEQFARKYTTPPFIKLAGGAMTSQTFIRGETADTRVISERAAQKAFELTGISPQDVDMAEIHDNFTVSEMEHIVDLGFCKEDEVGPFMEQGVFEISGRLPVSMSGGLLGKGHPTSATGAAQICELVWQIRGLAGARQVKNPKVGVSHCCGGDEGMACCVNIVKI